MAKIDIKPLDGKLTINEAQLNDIISLFLKDHYGIETKQIYIYASPTTRLTVEYEVKPTDSQKSPKIKDVVQNTSQIDID